MLLIYQMLLKLKDARIINHQVSYAEYFKNVV